jgi:hypothetical protein
MKKKKPLFFASWKGASCSHYASEATLKSLEMKERVHVSGLVLGHLASQFCARLNALLWICEEVVIKHGARRPRPVAFRL